MTPSADYNYPFQKSIKDKIYLLVYEEYKKQLSQLTRDARGFNDTIPPYQETYLKEYIEKYNKSFPDQTEINKAKSKKLTYGLATTFLDLRPESVTDVALILK